MLKRFKEFVAEDEELGETARANLWRNLTKWGAGRPEGMIDRPVALMSAFVKEPRDEAGNLVKNPAQMLKINRARNQQLSSDLAALD